MPNYLYFCLIKNVGKVSIPYFISFKFAIIATYSSSLKGDKNKEFITLERTYSVGETFEMGIVLSR